MSSTEHVVRVLRDDNEAMAAEFVRQEGGSAASLSACADWLTPSELRSIGRAALSMAGFLDSEAAKQSESGGA